MSDRWFIADYRDWKAVATKVEKRWEVRIYEDGQPDKLTRQFNFGDPDMEQEAVLGQAIIQFREELYSENEKNNRGR